MINLIVKAPKWLTGDNAFMILLATQISVISWSEDKVPFHSNYMQRLKQ